MEIESGEPPQLKGVVIISLPPPNNPSLGKTITAFTLSNSSSPHNHLPLQTPQLPIGLPLNHQNEFFFRRNLFKIPTTIWGILAIISLVALIFWVSAYPRTLFEFRNSDDDDRRENPNSFLFPLYPKMGIQEMLQRNVKLGKFVKFNPKNAVLPVDDGVMEQNTKRVSTASTVLPVRGDSYPDGLYYTQILVGTPPRPYYLDIDTGSDLTWIQCDAPCTSCAKGAHPFYKPTKGNIISSKDSFCVEVQATHGNGYCETCHQCDYEIEYADHSSSMGVLSRDDLHLADANETLINSKVVFGCAYDQQGLLLNSLTKTDGIIGLSKAKVSLPSQLARQGIIDNVIGHCLATDSGSGGYMFLGNDFVPHGKMAWVSMLNDASMNSYITAATRMTYGSNQLSLNGQRSGHGRIVFDSGSSYTYFTKQAYSDLVTSLKDVREGLIQDTSDKTLPLCWRTRFTIRSVKDVRKFFKPITLQFGRKWWIVSTTLQIPPEGYLIINNKGNVCLGVLDGSEVYDGSTIILGDISMRGQLIVYDNVNQKIGWMQSDCVKPWRSKTLQNV